MPRFRGPDEARRLLIGPEPADPTAGGEAEAQGRWVITSTDWPTIVSGLDARVVALEDGRTGGGTGDVIATAHPLIWSLDGDAETRTSKHPYWKEEGKAQTVTGVRAQATVTSGSITCNVLTIDPSTQATAIIATVLLDGTTSNAVVAPEASVSDGTGLTVAVQLGDGHTRAL